MTAAERNQQIHAIRFAIHHKKRKLNALELKLISLTNDINTNHVRICFGSKSLYNKQFNLEENRYTSHEEWRSDWKQAWSSQSFCLGSKDENGGNQSCTYSLITI